MTPKKKSRGQPRVNEPGSMNTYVRLAPDVRAQVEKMADAEQRSVSRMLKILIEEALRARQK
jgi:hypothetical protein